MEADFGLIYFLPMNTYLDFCSRHLGVIGDDAQAMLKEVGYDSFESFLGGVVPANIFTRPDLGVGEALSEHASIEKLKSTFSQNKVHTNFIGLGYHGTLMPYVIQRNIFENPGWYTAYTPYQAEIAQGRMEALMNFQTMICNLTGLDVANASLLDEGTALAEAMTLAQAQHGKGKTIFVADTIHQHTIDVLVTRAEPLGFNVIIGDWQEFDPCQCPELFAVAVQYPNTLGQIETYDEFFAKAHEAKAYTITVADILALCVLREPAAFGTDICVGSSQRFGVPMGFGGPHAAFMACKDALKRRMPGRLIGLSIDSQGKPAYRLSLQTREQHIRRDKATSNICTAQVLLAVLASMYAVYHGPEGLKNIAFEVHAKTSCIADILQQNEFVIYDGPFFDTLVVNTGKDSASYLQKAEQAGLNLRGIGEEWIGISFDEAHDIQHLQQLLAVFGINMDADELQAKLDNASTAWNIEADRVNPLLPERIFNSFHTETEMLRYISRLEAKDLALNTAMIPLGSCTMKLNATAEMMPLSWPELSNMHPFAPQEQVKGYIAMLDELCGWLANITGFAAVSLQPNAGSQGEYAGLLAIRGYHLSRGDQNRNVCLIPLSAHGTNPASAAMAGMKIIGVACDERGNIDVADLRAKAAQHAANLSCLMVTYPSTHGVFEETIIEICDIIHEFGGQVYMDGANMNAQVGLTSPGAIHADVCHLNLHKTFAIPHGGGGPGVGPIGVAAHLIPFLPGHRYHLERKEGAVCSAPWGSASINVISYQYIAMMGSDGLLEATATAILNANYIAKKLEPYYPVLYTGANGLVAHECILDIRPLSEQSGITVEDIAKRLMDYGFHAPTMSWPVGGTLMIEPTESESKYEIDRFIEAMISIHQEIMEVVEGRADAHLNVLKGAPHTAAMVSSDDWDKPYSRQKAAYPVKSLYQFKFWPSVGRVDNVYGDRNLVCSCDPVSSYCES